MNTITVKEFAAMPETERAILTYEVLTRLDNGIAELKEDMKYVKKCADDGQLLDAEARNKIEKAQATAESAKASASFANRRIDKFLTWALVTLIGAIITIATAIIIFLTQRGLSL